MGAVSWAQRQGRFPVPFGFAPCPHDEKSAHPLAGTVAFQGMDAFVLLL